LIVLNPVPLVPLVPEVPFIPLVPLAPVIPDVPDVPVNPEVPLVPLEPEDPLVPLVPLVPLAPLAPDVPEVPLAPEVPEVPLLPEVPLDPDEPLVPLVPLVPPPPPPPDILIEAVFALTVADTPAPVKFRKVAVPCDAPSSAIIIDDTIAAVDKLPVASATTIRVPTPARESIPTLPDVTVISLPKYPVFFVFPIFLYGYKYVLLMCYLSEAFQYLVAPFLT
jgi:hypothetical protein